MGWKPRNYDPRLKLDVRNGYIPEELKDKIDNSLISKWKKEKWNHLVGFHYYNKKEHDLRFLNQELFQQKTICEVLRSENEVHRILIKILANSRESERLLFKHKGNIIDVVEKNKKRYGVKNISKLLHLNKNTYYDWKQLNKGECSYSKNFLCAKRHPNKLSIIEEDKIAEILMDPKYAFYPISSLIWMAHYSNSVHAGRNVWDRVRKERCIIRKRFKKKRKTYRDKLIASYANQYLHADVTYFKTDNEITYYIFLVKDNYSKLIKSWAISNSINPDTRLRTFQEALRDIPKGHEYEISFVTDSGNENISNSIKEYFAEQNNVNLLIARKDIPYSNSMIERYNHDLKYIYLCRERIGTFKELCKMVEIAVKDHNYTKRMQSLNGQTPYEIYNGIPSKNEWIIEQWKLSKQKRRREINRLVCCIGKTKTKK
jgi:hypothetical protein